MEKIKLENYKSTLIISILLLLLGFVILYWGLFTDIKIKISGAKFDRTSSSILLFLISLGPILSGINYLIKYRSVLKYGEFVIVIHHNGISYPEDHFFKGFKKVFLDKESISFAELENIGQHKYQINLKNENGLVVGKISGDLPHRKSISTVDFTNKLNQWLHS